jgi:hypothetical protein
MENAHNPKTNDKSKRASFILFPWLKRKIARRPPSRVSKKRCAFCALQNAYNPKPTDDAWIVPWSATGYAHVQSLY